MVKPSIPKIKSHILGSHTPAFCEECNKEYKDSGSLSRHKRAMHWDRSKKNFQCEFCPYVTHHGPYLYEHKARKHGHGSRSSIYTNVIASGVQVRGTSNKYKQNVCNECNVAFNNKGRVSF